MKTLNCFCCGAEITAPQFHEGKAYGWTCIKKVKPEAKQTKAKFYLVELVAKRPAPFMSRTEQAFAVTFRYNGKKWIAHVAQSQMTEQDGETFMSEHVLNKLK